MTGKQVSDSPVFRTARLPAEQSLGVFGPDDLATRLRAIQRVTDAALAHLKLDALLGALLERVRDALDVDTVRVLLCTPSGTELSVRAALGLIEAPEATIPVPIGKGIAGWVAHNRTAVIVDDPSKVAVVNPLIRQLSSAMVAPLLVEGALIGVLKVGTTRKRRFNDADLGLLQMVADRMALAIDRTRHVEAAARAREQAAERDQKYRSLFENNHAAVFSLDTDGRFTSLNPAAERISGYSAKDWLGRTFASLLVEDAGDRVLQGFRRTLQGEPAEARVTIRHKQGHRIELRVIAVPATEGGVVTGVFGIAEDITAQNEQTQQQQRLLDELQSQSGFLEAVLDQMPAGVLLVEAPSGRVIRGNTRASEMLGHEFPDTPDILAYAAWEAYHADGTRYQPEEWPLARVIQEGQTVNGEEMRYQRGDGSRAWLRVNAAPIFDRLGRIVAGVAVISDVEQEMRAAEEMRFLADVSGALHATLDYRQTLRQIARLCVPRFSDWCVIDLLDASGRVLRQQAAHHDPEREAWMKDLQRRYPTRYENPESPLGNALRSGRPILVPEVTDALLARLAKDAEHTQIMRELGVNSLIVVPMQGRERMLGAISFANSETQRRFTEHDVALAEEIGRRSAIAIENAELYAQASEANQAKSDFLAVMSHELRTPLAAIMGYAELLQMGIPVPVPEPALRQVERIDQAARHQLQLIEEILTFSRLSAGEEMAVVTTVDLAGTVLDAVAFIRPAAEKKGLALRVEVPPGPIEIRTDAGKLRQVLVNLLFNAVHFTPSGEVGVEVAPTAGEILVRVRDTGIGIASEHQRKIFDPFWQVKQSSTREVGGTGLGLTVAQRIMHVLGGDVRVSSELGRGSTFTVRLPLTPPGPAD